MPTLTLEQVKELVKGTVAEEMASLQTRNGMPGAVAALVSGASGGTATPKRAKRYDEDPTLAIGAMVRALAASKGDPERAARFMDKQYGDYTGEFFKDISKALGSSDAISGGFIVPEQWSEEIIEFLRPQTVVRKLDPMVMPMPTGTVRVPKITTGSVGSYIGENTNLPITAQQFGELVLTWKKLGAFVPVSNDLLRFSSPQADSIVRDDLVRAMAQAEDLNFIRSDGSQFAPKGLRYWAPASTNVIPTSGATLANIQTDLSALILALKNANVRMIKPAWIMSPRTEMTLMTITNAQGFYVFRQEMLTGKLWSYPYLTTTQIPTNLGGGSNQTEIYFADFADVVIGESSELIIDASTEAAYYDGAAVQPAFSLDQTVVRAIARHDFGMRHDFSVAILTGATY